MIKGGMCSSGIYQIRNLINGKKYIGSTTKLKKRGIKHLNDLKLNRHYSKYLQSDYNKYGKENFLFEVLEYVEDNALLISREQFHLDSNKDIVYNLRVNAYSNRGIQYPQEYKKRMSDIRKGIKFSEEHRKNISRARKGKPSTFLGKHHSPEAKLEMSKKRKGLNAREKHPMWGVHHTEEYKAKMSQSQKGLQPGIKNPNSKLTESQVAEIKKLLMDGLTQSETGRMFNVSQHAIWSIKTGRTWAHIQAESCKGMV